MLAPITKRPDASLLPVWNAVFCCDCEMISNSAGEECPACTSRSLVSLARILGGSLAAHGAKKSQDSALFDVTIAVELPQMYAKDLSTLVERLTNVIAPQLAQDRGTLHVDVRPTTDKLNSQAVLTFLERDAA